MPSWSASLNASAQVRTLSHNREHGRTVTEYLGERTHRILKTLARDESADEDQSNGFCEFDDPDHRPGPLEGPEWVLHNGGTDTRFERAPDIHTLLIEKQ